MTKTLDKLGKLTAMGRHLSLPTSLSHGVMKTALSVVLIGAVAFGAGCSKKPEAKGEGHSSLVQAETVAIEDMSNTISGTGSVAAWQEAPVAAEVGGYTATALLVDEGDYVKQGQPLLKMNDVILQAQFRQAEAQASQASKAYARAKELFDKGYLAKAALDNAEASQKTTQATLDQAKVQLALATIKAPISGIVASRKAVLGQMITPGAELFRIVRDGRIELNMEVVETKLSLIKPGQAAVVTSELGQPVTGTVRIVTPMVDSATRLGVARISVPWSSGLRPGMFARGEINLGATKSMLISQKAVIYHENKPGAYVVDGASKVHYTPIELGETSGQKVTVRSGLKVGDRVITTGAGFLNNGDSVKLAPGSAREAN